MEKGKKGRGRERKRNQKREIGMIQLQVRNAWLVAIISSSREAKRACTPSQRKHGFLASDAWVLDLQPIEL